MADDRVSHFVIFFTKSVATSCEGITPRMMPPTGSSGHRPQDRPVSRSEAEEIRVGWKMAGVGMQVASEVVAGTLLGWLFDYWRGHGHAGVLVGSVCGICVGLFSLIRQSLRLNALLDRTAPLAGRGQPIPPREPVRRVGEDGGGGDWQEQEERAEQALQEMEKEDRLAGPEWNDDDGDWNDNKDDSATEQPRR
jgi:F0F1-type ATP synthase assembly protein I